MLDTHKTLINTDIFKSVVAYDKLEEAIRIVYEIIENLDEQALNEILSGSGNDIDKLIQSLTTETYASLFGGIEANSNIGNFAPTTALYLDKLTQTIEETLRVESLTYFILSVMPEFEMNWHHVEWSELVQSYKWACILAARSHGKSFMFTNAVPSWRLYRYNKFSKRKELAHLGKEGYLFSFSKDQAGKLLTVLKENIEGNDILREKLYPGKDGWAQTKIDCKNGTRIVTSSAGASVRGAHPGWVIVDDFLKDNVIFSKELRDKYTSYFHSVIMNMVEPGGQVIVVGTPFHSQDLYADLKGKPSWHYREYPSIFPDGKILWENRFSLSALLEARSSQGSVNFSRENLCRPITSDSSIFPYHILERSLIGMQHFKMVNNIESFPKKFERVAIGVDWAISGAVSADFTVFCVVGMDENGVTYILKIQRLHGKSYGEQMSVLKKLYIDFKPSIIFTESNSFQLIFTQMGLEQNLPIISEPTTSKNRNDLHKGVPGIAIRFETGKIKIPYGDQHSKDMKDLLFSELLGFTFSEKGIVSAEAHDDTVFALHQALKGLDYKHSNLTYAFM